MNLTSVGRGVTLVAVVSVATVHLDCSPGSGPVPTQPLAPIHETVPALRLTALPDSVAADGSSIVLLEATLLGSHGTPVVGADLSFRVLGLFAANPPTPGGPIDLGRLSSESAQTDSLGVARVSYRAPFYATVSEIQYVTVGVSLASDASMWREIAIRLRPPASIG